MKVIQGWYSMFQAWLAKRRYDGLVARAKTMGYVVITEEAFASAAITLGTLSTYVDKSGHLNTVKGRKPRAIARLIRGLARTANSLAVGLTQRGTQAA